MKPMVANEAATASRTTARRMSRERPLQPVLALTPKPETARRLALVWGLEPRLGEQPTSLEGLTEDKAHP